MELINTTFLTAGINVGTPNPMQKERRAALVVAKATFREKSPGVFEPDTDAPYPLYSEDQETGFGLLPRDDFPKFNSGVDIIVLGQACAPEGKPCASMRVSLHIGNSDYHLMVFGNRRWQKTSRGLTMTEPELFLNMPVNYEHAYGGSVEFDHGNGYLTMYYPHNPGGKGYIRDEDKAEGTPLPNIENPKDLINDWKDQPFPACWSAMPLYSFVHGQRGVELKDANVRIKPQFYARAHPELVLSGLKPGEKTVLSGMTPDFPFSFRVPGWTVSAFCRVGKQSEEQTARANTLVILPEERRFYMVYRFWFDFPFIPGMYRAVRLQVDRAESKYTHIQGRSL